MSYPGNSALSEDIRARIETTFQQTLDLASQGNRQEAFLGCDFILQLDPQFEPARALLGRLEQGHGPVGVEDLRSGTAGGATGPNADGVEARRDREVEELFGDPEPTPGAVDLSELEPVPEGGGKLRTELRRLLEERQFGELVDRARQHDAAVASDPELARLVEAAVARQEAEPYIQSFLDSARRELRAGDFEKAGKLVDNARELDPEHPAIADLDRLIAAGTGAAATPPPAAPPPRSVSPPPPAPPPSSAPSLAAPPPPRPAAAPEPAPEAPLFAEPEPAGTGPAAAPADLTAPGGAADSIELEPEGDGRIQELLAEGQSAFERRDYQTAIDAWSRIFLIDIDHQEAARRIEEARRLKAELERQVEEIFHEAMESLEGGDAGKAQGLFGKVLALQPGHLAAREYLQRIEAGETPPAPPSPPPAAAAPPAAADLLQEDILVPPETAGRRAAARPRKSAVARARSRKAPSRSFVLIGGAVLVVVLVSIAIVWSQWERFFPNVTEEPPAATAPSDPVAQATALQEQGQTRRAISLLRRIPASHPRHREAQALISRWQALETPAGAEPAEPEGPTAAEVEAEAEAERLAHRGELLAEARAAMASSEHLMAEELLQEAAAIAELDAGDEELLAQAKDRLTPLRQQIELLRGGDWEYVLPDLWRLHDAEPANRDITRLLINAYYNLGVRDLQRGDAGNAVERFEEAVALAGDDEELGRHLLFARSYTDRSKDLLYQIYVKYIPLR